MNRSPEHLLINKKFNFFKTMYDKDGLEIINKLKFQFQSLF